MPAEKTEFKGNPMICLRRSDIDRYPMQFGVSKAKLILDHIEEIKKFVAGEELTKEPEKTEKEIKKEEKDGEFI